MIIEFLKGFLKEWHSTKEIMDAVYNNFGKDRCGDEKNDWGNPVWKWYVNAALANGRRYHNLWTNNKDEHAWGPIGEPEGEEPKGGEPEDEESEEEESEGFFRPYYEEDLRDCLEKNPTLLEEGLELVGKEYHASGVGYIDLLFTDQSGMHVVVELKKGLANDKVIVQILGYMEWVKSNLNQNVRGIIVAKNFDKKFENAVKFLEDRIKLKYYRTKFEIIDNPD